MAESDDLRNFIRELMDEFDRKMAAHEERMERYFEELRASREPERPRVEDDFAEDRRQRALLLEKARRLGRQRP